MFGRRIYFFKVFTNLTVFLIAKAEYIYHVCVYAKSLQLCLTLCDSMDYSPPGSTVRGILQARILEWVAMPSFRGIFLNQGWNLCLLCLLHWQVGSLPLVPPGVSIAVVLRWCENCWGFDLRACQPLPRKAAAEQLILNLL